MPVLCVSLCFHVNILFCLMALSQNKLVFSPHCIFSKLDRSLVISFCLSAVGTIFCRDRGKSPSQSDWFLYLGDAWFSSEWKHTWVLFPSVWLLPDSWRTESALRMAIVWDGYTLGWQSSTDPRGWPETDLKFLGMGYGQVVWPG